MSSPSIPTTKKHRIDRCFSENTKSNETLERLTLGELEALAGTWATGLLTFFHTGVTGQHAVLLEDTAVLGVRKDQRTGDAHADGTHLAGHATTVRTDVDVIALGRVGKLKGSQKLVLKAHRREVVVERTAVHGDGTAAILEVNPGDGVLAAAGGVKRSGAHELTAESKNGVELGQLKGFRALGFVGVLVTLVNLELRVNSAAEAVVGDHALDSLLEHQFGMLLAQALRIGAVVATDVTGEGGVHLVGFFLAGKAHVLRIDDHHVVAGVHMGGENGLVLATQDVGSGHRHSSEHLVLGVNDPPLALDFFGFGGKRFHVLSWLLNRVLEFGRAKVGESFGQSNEL